MPSEYDTPDGAVDFQYSGTTERIRKQTADEVTLYLGGFYERVTDTSSRSITERHYIRVGDRVVAVHERQDGTSRFTPPTFDTVYIHTDNLGSVDVITDAKGDLVERRSYDAFGARRNPVWDAATQPKSFTSPGTTLGYTGQEADDELGLVNMKGRIYDPKLARFLTPDPVVSRPLSGQGWNRYSYVLNNPLRYVDPSGFEDAPADGGENSSDGEPAPNTPLTGGEIVLQQDLILGHAPQPTNGDPTPEAPPGEPVTPVIAPNDTSSDGQGATRPEGQVSGPAADPGLGVGDFIWQTFETSANGVQSISDRVPVPGPLSNFGRDADVFTDANSSLLRRTFAGVGLVFGVFPLAGEDVSLLRSAADRLGAAQLLGDAGEKAVRAVYYIGPLEKTRIVVDGRARFPDGLKDGVLSEVKNVAKLSYTSQLRDYAQFAKDKGLQFDLYVRPGTQLSGPLDEAVQSGVIKLRQIPSP